MKPKGSTRKLAKVTLAVKQLEHGQGLPLPQYQSDEAAGADLLAAIGKDAPLMLEPGERALVPTGIALQIPKGFEAQVRPRSGLAWRHGVTVLNSPGTIDSDYRGELHVLLINFGTRTVMIERGERIAQLVLAPVVRAVMRDMDRLSDSRRGAGGFGSTGRKTALPRAKTAAKPAARTKARKSRATGNGSSSAMAAKPNGKTSRSQGKSSAKSSSRSSIKRPVKAPAKAPAKSAKKRASSAKSATTKSATARAKAKSNR